MGEVIVTMDVVWQRWTDGNGGNVVVAMESVNNAGVTHSVVMSIAIVVA